MVENFFYRLAEWISPLNKGPYIEFPKFPKKIMIDGCEAYEYISQKELNKRIKEFAKNIDLNEYDAVLINLVGGKPFADDLIRLKGFTGKVIDIEYHEDGSIVKPVPEELRYKKVCVVDDVLDQGITAEKIQDDAPNAEFTYLLRKVVVGQNKPNICRHVCLVDNEWLLGKGMNGEKKGDKKYPKDWGRSYPGIAVRPQS